MARIFLTHIPDMLRNYYGERAVAAVDHQTFDTVRQVAELVAGRLPPYAVNPDAATRLARLRKA